MIYIMKLIYENEKIKIYKSFETPYFKISDLNININIEFDETEKEDEYINEIGYYKL